MAIASFAATLHNTLISRVTLAGAFFTVLTLAKTYPLIRHFGTHLPGDLGDPLLVTWILAWNVHALTTDPWNMFNANIFYPVQNTLAFSEHMIAVVPFFAPTYLATGNPIFAYNTVFLLSFIFCGMTMFLLVHYWTGSFWASLLSGCLFAFAPIRFTMVSHLQLYNFYWTPLAFIFLDKFVRTQYWADLTYFAIFYWLQMLSSIYLGWLVTIASGIYLLYSTICIKRDLFSRTMILRYVTFIVLSALILLPFHLPYFSVRHQWGFTRYLQDYAFYAADPLLSYFSPPHLFNEAYLSLVRAYFPSLAYPRNHMMLFPGFVTGILVLACSLPSVSSSPVGKTRQLTWLFGLVCLVSFLFSLGPFLVILGKHTAMPLPFLLFYYLAPAFQAVRVPARFALMVVLAASVLAGLGFLKAGHLLRAIWPVKLVSPPMRHGLFALFWIGVFLLELGFKPLPLEGVPTGDRVPEVYRWLAARQLNGPIVEVPLGRDFYDALQYQYVYASTYHWLPIVNGVSGHTPPPYDDLAAKMTALPSRRAAELLRALGVKGVILHTDRLEPAEASRWRGVDLSENGLQEVARFGSDVVYGLSPIDVEPQLHVALTLPDRLPTGQIMQLPAGALITLGLLAESKSPRPWVHPLPLGRTQVMLKWEEVQSGKILIQADNSVLPFAISAGEVWSTGVPARSPLAPGQYRLSLSLPSLGLETASKLVQVISSGVHTSASASQLLSAAYVLEEPSAHTITASFIDVTLHVTNTGQNVWLADAKNDRGAVRLGWRWYRGNERVPFQEGRELLPYDIFPEQAYRFKTTIKSPLEPGEYTLELGLVCELLTWFSDRGVPPLNLVIRVGSSAKPSPL